jgi:hypothetical protein
MMHGPSLSQFFSLRKRVGVAALEIVHGGAFLVTSLMPARDDLV